MTRRIPWVVADMQGRNHIIFAMSSMQAEELSTLYFRAGLPIAYVYEPGTIHRIEQCRRSASR